MNKSARRRRRCDLLRRYNANQGVYDDARTTAPPCVCFSTDSGAVHGSVYFKAADDAAFFAANSLVRDVFVLTSTFHLSFLRPIQSGILRAEGRVVQAARNLILADSILYDSKGREIGRGTGSFAKSRIALTPEIGYV